MIRAKIISSLEKAFIDSNIDSFEAFESISILKNERLSFQLIFTDDGSGERIKRTSLHLSGPLSAYATVRQVINVPSSTPYTDGHDGRFLYTEPTNCPDILAPMRADGRVTVMRDRLLGVWIEIDLREANGISSELSGEFQVTLGDGSKILSKNSIEISIIDAVIPEQSLICTDWLHCDCLAQQYGCEVWSEKHWEIVENFARTAVSNGMNMLLTPIFTPALDTAVGGERLTNQLLTVTLENGIYAFDFTLLDRWIDMCDRIGIKYFEISHLFTQWGARHAPKVMATVDGEYKRIFGWDTDAADPEYVAFIRLALGEFIAHMKSRGDNRRCYYHISDEPQESQLESYQSARNSVADLLEGYVIMDACSHIEYYEQGIVTSPIPANNMIKPFLDAEIPGLWTYYCCCQWDGVSNRLMAMPSWRNRCLGAQLFKYDIAGFLHWGYNFYLNQLSVNPVIPFLDASADGAFPDGDAFSVYPASNGTALESIRMVVFYEGLQDMRAMQLCSELYGKEAVISALEDELSEIRFDRCPGSAAPILRARKRINSMIREKL